HIDGDLNVLARGAAAVIADAIDHQVIERVGRADELAKLLDRVVVDGAVVPAVCRGFVEGEDLRTIRRFLPEEWDFLAGAAEVVIVDAGLLEDLRHGPGVAEGVGLPADGADAAEFFLEVALAVEKVPDVRLGRDHVGVTLAPAAA